MVDPKKLEMIPVYEEALNQYKMRKWDAAIDGFKKALSIYPSDGPSALYLQRSMDFKNNPPSDDWDGVFVMSTK